MKPLGIGVFVLMPIFVASWTYRLPRSILSARASSSARLSSFTILFLAISLASRSETLRLAVMVTSCSIGHNTPCGKISFQCRNRMLGLLARFYFPRISRCSSQWCLRIVVGHLLLMRERGMFAGGHHRILQIASHSSVETHVPISSEGLCVSNK